MDKNLYSKLISIGAILMVTIYPLQKILESRSNIYTNDIWNELFFIYPFLSGLTVIILYIILTAFFIIIDLRNTENYNNISKYDKIKEKIIHTINVIIIFYVITELSMIFINLLIIQSGFYRIYIIVGFIIIIIAIIINLFKNRKMKSYKIRKWKREFFKLSGYEYFYLFLIYIVILFFCMAWVYTNSNVKYNINFNAKEDGEINITIESDKELQSLCIYVNDSAIEYDELKGNVSEIKNNDKDYRMLNHKYYYTIKTKVKNYNTNGNNKISAKIEFQPYVKINNEVSFEDEFRIEDERFFYANSNMTFSQ